MGSIERRLRGAVGPLALVLGAGLAGCAGEEASGATEATEVVGRQVSVEVLELVAEPFRDFVQVVGTVEANRDVVVSAEEAGTIVELLVAKGARVQAGQAIARIDDRVLRPQAEQAASEAALARETYERQRRLWEEDGVGSEMAYLRAMYAAQTADAGARVLRERLARTVVRAPIAGILDARMVEVGALVSPGTPIARVIDVSTVKIDGGVPERFAGEVQRGGEAEVALDGPGGRAFTGRIDFVGASVTGANRTFPVEINVPNPGGELKPGMIATVRIARQMIDSAIVVPQEAVLRVEDGYVVYVVDERSGTPLAEMRPVALGPTRGNRVLIDAGLQAGERVIVVGQNRVAQGDRLQIIAADEGRI